MVLKGFTVLEFRLKAADEDAKRRSFKPRDGFDFVTIK